METWKVVGLFVGLFFGGAPVLSASWTWLKKQILGLSGGGLLGSGTIILIVALAAFGDWKMLKAHSDSGNWSVELQKARQEIDSLNKHVRMLTAKNEELDAQFGDLSSEVQAEFAGLKVIDQKLKLQDQQYNDIITWKNAYPATELWSKLGGELEEIKGAVFDLGKSQIEIVEWGQITEEQISDEFKFFEKTHRLNNAWNKAQQALWRVQKGVSKVPEIQWESVDDLAVE